MSVFVSSNASPMLMDPSQKETILVSDSLLLNRYTTTVHYLKEKKQDNVYHQPSDESKGQRNSLEGGSALEEEDTESEEDDDEFLLPSNKEHAHFKQGNTPPAATAAAVTADSGLNKPLSTSISHPVLSPIQTYSPQLNLGIYSLCSTPISSVRSTKNNLAYKSRQSLPSASSCFAETSTTVENPTKISSLNKQQKPLYSTSTSSPSIASTIKMDIRSPPQPSQSTSRFMNAFQRFRNPSLNHHINRQNANNNNSVAPAEISTSIKPSPSKSSLADKIKTKFQQKRASFVDSTSPRSSSRANSINSKKKYSLENPVSTSGFSMPRSTSISSISQWSSRLTANKVTTNAPPSKPSGNRLSIKLSHSTSMTSFLGSSNKPEKTLKPSLSFSSSSSAGSLSEAATSHTTVSTVKTPPPSQPLSLTKSISSHRLYKSNTTQGAERPRQPLRAVNPNDSVRFSRGQKPLQPVKNKNTKKSIHPSVRFVKVVSIKETFSKTDYDRGSDPDAVCIRLTPAMAQSIKEELNAYKLHEMQVHECSRVHTHFFL